MDFKDELIKLSKRVAEQRGQIVTEEATKTAFVLPFIQILGYDIFNPHEVEPEYTCDVGTKKGEKVDYAIKQNGELILLVECKHWRENLDLHRNQLFRYYVVSRARFAILTNGVQYRFFSDSDRINVMDSAPFFEFDITEINEWQIGQLMKFRKLYFNEHYIHETIPSVKYVSGTIVKIKNLEIDIESNRIIHNQELWYYQKEADRTERELEQKLEQSRREFDACLQKISELEETLRVREAAVAESGKVQKAQKTDLEALVDYLNMPVPDDWYKKTIFERKHYWMHERAAWHGKPRETVCTSEVAREFLEMERGELTPRKGREIGDSIRRTGLFAQDGSKKNFGDYGACLAWVRTKSLMKALKDVKK